MRTIRKGPPPATLRRYQSEPHGTWDRYPHKDDAREALCKEQGYLCAFCCSRIEAEDANLQVKIGVAPDKNRGVRCAHWMPQSVDPSLQLQWDNLFAACFGGEGTDTHFCDVAQADIPLHIHPARGQPAPEDVFRYRPDGTIHSDHLGAAADIQTLNLNCDRLRLRRKALIDAIYDFLARPGARTVAELRQRRDSYAQATERLEPFAPVAIYILDQQIRRRSPQS